MSSNLTLSVINFMTNKTHVIEILRLSKARPTMFYTTNGECDSAIWAYFISFGFSHGPNAYERNAGADLRFGKVPRNELTSEWVTKAVDDAISVLESK